MGTVHPLRASDAARLRHPTARAPITSAKQAVLACVLVRDYQLTHNQAVEIIDRVTQEITTP